MENHNTIESDQRREERKRLWQEKMDEMLKPDVYGYVLDEKIREAVVALNLLGIPTTQSDHGNYSESPWIEFMAPEPQYFYVGERELRHKVLEQKGLSEDVMDEKSPLFNREEQVDVWSLSRDVLMKEGALETEEFTLWNKQTLELVGAVNRLIDEYYSNQHELHDEQRVHIEFPYREAVYARYDHNIPFLTVSIPERIIEKEERGVIVQKTQQEMERFGRFLKEKFLSSEKI